MGVQIGPDPLAGVIGVSSDDRGDLALAPYYTTRDDWVTGLHIVNTSDRTQVANVITFGGKRVFGAMAHNIDVDLGQPYGWVSARVRSRDADVRVCDWDRKQDNAAGFPGATAGRALTLECTALTNKNVPVIGFAAWSRKMAVNPDASYGRIVEHSYRTEAATPATPPSP